MGCGNLSVSRIVEFERLRMELKYDLSGMLTVKQKRNNELICFKNYGEYSGFIRHGTEMLSAR